MVSWWTLYMYKVLAASLLIAMRMFCSWQVSYFMCQHQYFFCPVEVRLLCATGHFSLLLESILVARVWPLLIINLHLVKFQKICIPTLKRKLEISEGWGGEEEGLRPRGKGGGGGGEWVKLNYRGSILHSDLVVQNNKLLLFINLLDLSWMHKLVLVNYFWVNNLLCYFTSKVSWKWTNQKWDENLSLGKRRISLKHRI